MNKFIEQANRIISEHRAQYKGVYYMKGGFLGKILGNPITQIVSDVAATALGQPELIPVINAGETAVGDTLQGDSIGKSLGQGALSGAEALGAQELGGAVGIGQGNTAFNSLTGITDTPASTGLPDIGSGFNNVLSQLGVGGSTTTGAGSADSITSPNLPNIQGSNVDTTLNSTSPTTTAGPASGTNLSPGETQFLNQSGVTPSTVSGGSAFNAAANAPVSSASAGTGTPNTGGTFSNFINSIKSNPLSAAAVAGAGISAIKGNQAAPQTSNLQALQGQDSSLASQLNAAGTTGNLLPGQEATLDAELQNNITQIRSQYASMGLSGSSSEQQAIQQAQQAAAAQRTNIMNQLISTGLTASGQADTVTQQLATSQLNQDQQLQNALLALAGAGGGTTKNQANQPAA